MCTIPKSNYNFEATRLNNKDRNRKNIKGTPRNPKEPIGVIRNPRKSTRLKTGL